MKRQTSRPIVVTLGILLLVAAPTQAGPIQFADVVVRTLIDGQTGRQSVDLQLRSLAQIAMQLQNGQQNSPAAPNSVAAAPSILTGDGPGASLTSVIVGPLQDSDIVEIGEVTGTVCDCGQIPLGIIAAAGLPKLPFLLLAALPLAFIDLSNSNPLDTVIPPGPPVPPVPPTPNPIPEPATMFLFGSGLLGLGAHTSRRRRARRSSEKAEAGGF